MTTVTVRTSTGVREVQVPTWAVAYVSIRGRVIGAHGPFLTEADAQAWVATIGDRALYARHLWSVRPYLGWRKEHPRIRLLHPMCPARVTRSS